MKILIVTPACNEEHHLSDLIKSVLAQSHLPEEWIIVDDGSQDNTSDVIQKATINHDWIKYLRKEQTGIRSPGKSVIEAFYFGFLHKTIIDYDIIIRPYCMNSYYLCQQRYC